MRTSKKYLYIIFGCIIFLLLVKPIQAQQQIMGPSTHLTDMKSVFANPALVSFQGSRFSTGIKAYHLNLVDASGIPLSQGFASISTPSVHGAPLGAAINVQHFNSPIYRQSNFSMATAVRLFRYVSIGGQLSALNISYNSDNFELEHRYDPVFQQGLGKTTINSAIGLFTQPTEFIGLSLGVRNLNEPNVSLIGDDVREPREFFTGFALIQGAFRSSLEIIKGKDHLDGKLFLEAFSSSTGDYVRAGSNYYLDQGSIEGQLRIAGPLSVNYQFTLPLSSVLGPSSGSHMFSLIYEFGRKPRHPKPVTPPRNRVTFEQPDITPAPPESRVYVSSERDTLKIYEKKITREIDPAVSDQALRSVSLYDLVVLDKDFASEDNTYTTEQVDSVSDQVEFQDLISPEYTSFIQDIGKEPGMRVSVISDSSIVERAIGLRNLIINEGASADAVDIETPVFRTFGDSLLYHTPIKRSKLVTAEEFTTLQPEELKLNLLGSYQEVPAESWQLTVRDSQDELVRTFTGTSDIPAEIRWDWLDASGDLIGPGIYTYQFSWANEDGISRLSNQRTLYVQKIQRNVTVHVTGNQTRMREQPDQVRILIKQ